MIYVSTACLPGLTAVAAVRRLVELGYRAIELSGGAPDPSWHRRIVRLRDRYGLRLRLHNYFPPPASPFVLNLASLDDTIFDRSVDLLTTAVLRSRDLGARRFGFHAGFRRDFAPAELGGTARVGPLMPRAAAIDRFRRGVAALQRVADDAVALYVENNVLGQANHRRFAGRDPLLFTDAAGFDALELDCAIRPLLDVAHLHVSARSLGHDFGAELAALFARTDYLHLSDNDGREDTGHGLAAASPLVRRLAECSWRDKTVTLEVTAGPEALAASVRRVAEWIARDL